MLTFVYCNKCVFRFLYYIFLNAVLFIVSLEISCKTKIPKVLFYFYYYSME